MQEIDAPTLVAIQTHLTRDSAPYDRLSASMEVLEIPLLREEARDALAMILTRRLEVANTQGALNDVLGDDALDALVQFYDETLGDVRKTLAAAHDAAEEAAEEAAAMRSILIRAPHVRVGAANWR